MAKQLQPLSFTRAVMRSFWAESGLEPRYIPRQVLAKFTHLPLEAKVLMNSRLLGETRFRVLKAINGRVDFELDIHKDHLNRLQTIHGGTLAALVDLGGSLAVASTGRFATGVSTDLNVTYLSPGGRAGDLLKGSAICDKIGKNLAYTTVTFHNSKGQLAARGSHTKFVSGTLSEEGPYFAPEKWAEEVD